jgi:hypothetical protein
MNAISLARVSTHSSAKEFSSSLDRQFQVLSLVKHRKPYFTPYSKPPFSLIENNIVTSIKEEYAL